MFCPKCGSEIKADDHFCVNCGGHVGDRVQECSGTKSCSAQETTSPLKNSNVDMRGVFKVVVGLGAALQILLWFTPFFDLNVYVFANESLPIHKMPALLIELSREYEEIQDAVAWMLFEVILGMIAIGYSIGTLWDLVTNAKLECIRSTAKASGILNIINAVFHILLASRISDSFNETGLRAEVSDTLYANIVVGIVIVIFCMVINSYISEDKSVSSGGEEYYCRYCGRIYSEGDSCPYCGTRKELSECDSDGKRMKELGRNDYDANYLESIKYEYGAGGEMIRELHYDKSKKLQSYNTYEYDSAGHVSKGTYYDSKGLCTGWYTCEYDGSGNMIKQIIYNADGTVNFQNDYKPES